MNAPVFDLERWLADLNAQVVADRRARHTPPAPLAVTCALAAIALTAVAAMIANGWL